MEIYHDGARTLSAGEVTSSLDLRRRREASAVGFCEVDRDTFGGSVLVQIVDYTAQIVGLTIQADDSGALSAQLLCHTHPDS